MRDPLSEPTPAAFVPFRPVVKAVLVLNLLVSVLPLAAQRPALQVVAHAQTGQVSGQDSDSTKPETHITPEQAQKLFGMVDELLKFSSDETGYPIKATVKRKLTTRNAVEAYIREKFDEDQDAKRMQRSEIVLKKFGMLDRDFDLKPFLLQLLKEQIEAYYDPKTKTVNMLDWVSPDEQKPVLAHELTHALQDQHVNLDKWSDQTPEDPSTTASEDIDHLAKDEMDTAREAVVEGQATAVMMDNILKPMGRSLIKDPEVVEYIKQQMTGEGNSPVMARAPLLLSESLLFPYREGLSFEQDVWMDKGQTAAFAGTLDRPPSSSWEIINPRQYEAGHHAPIPLLPNIHPLVDANYTPYDIGQIGELDVHILAQVFGGEDAARDLAPAWDGGLYWAGQLRSATAAEKATTKSIALFYLSVWKSPASAQAFAKLYVSSLGRIFSGLKPLETKANSPVPGSDNDYAAANDDEQIFDTDEGPVVITTRDRMVFISESFPLPVARKLSDLILSAQGTGELQMASSRPVGPYEQNRLQPVQLQPLTGSLVRFMSNCGVMKAAIGAGLKARKMAGVELAPAR